MEHENIYDLQRLVNSLFGEHRVGDPVPVPKPGEFAPTATRLDAIMRAESLDLDEDAMRIVTLLPPITYQRHQLCNQVNSALKGHGWTKRYRTVE